MEANVIHAVRDADERVNCVEWKAGFVCNAQGAF